MSSDEIVISRETSVGNKSKSIADFCCASCFDFRNKMANDQHINRVVGKLIPTLSQNILPIRTLEIQSGYNIPKIATAPIKPMIPLFTKLISLPSDE